jgi:acetyltransferase-like isoleucine patch superfamily enzyme
LICANHSTQREKSTNVMIARIRHAIFLIVEKFLRWCISPRLRARLLAMLGAKVGRNVRVSECQFINLGRGFSNLTLGDDVYIGPGCLIDLEGNVVLARGVTLSPRVSIITHNDPGSFHGSPLTRDFPKTVGAVRIGEYSWVGTGCVVLSGVEIGDRAVVGAMALVKGSLCAAAVHAGIPARKIRPIVIAID